MQVNFSFKEEFNTVHSKYADGKVHSGDDGDRLLRVALPRNLMAGFCKIKPLMAAGERLKGLGTFPNSDDFIPALLLVTRHCCLEKWFQISRLGLTFDMIDENGDGELDRDEIKTMMTRILGHEPEEFVVDNMIDSLDADGDGRISEDEFDVLLAKVHEITEKKDHRKV